MRVAANACIALIVAILAIVHAPAAIGVRVAANAIRARNVAPVTIGMAAMISATIANTAKIIANAVILMDATKF